MKFVVVSGGFDPVHVGHLRMFEEARRLGDALIVLVNNDNWLVKKKGYVFMPEDERVEIIKGFRCVDTVMLTAHDKDEDRMDVCFELEGIRSVRPGADIIFANGGDRKHGNIPEYDLCKSLGIQMRFGVGGDKAQSSSELVKKANEATHGTK